MRILILNWRDIASPASGGAELLTHEMAKKWVLWGNRVIQISSGFPGSRKKENIDNVEIIRLGRWWSVHFLAFFYYLKYLRTQIDVIVDEAHWFPFFARIYAPNKTILLVCEVANKLFFKLFPYPLAIIGRFFEKLYLLIYKKVPTLAISQSTKLDLTKEGFSKNNITVLPMGVSIPKNLKVFKKESQPTIIYLGRLNKQKGIDDAIEIFKFVKKELPKSKLWIVGHGDIRYVEKLKRKIDSVLPAGSVRFFGFVSEQKKFELLSRAHLLISPSVHEGWGIVPVEAGIVGTPTVAYNTSGIKDVLQGGKTGIILEDRRPLVLAREVIDLLVNKKHYKELVDKLIYFRQRIGWEETARVALKVLSKRL